METYLHLWKSFIMKWQLVFKEVIGAYWTVSGLQSQFGSHIKKNVLTVVKTARRAVTIKLKKVLS